MTHDRRHVREIFMQVAELPQGERGVAIERLCGADAALRNEVEILLRAERQAAADQFMNKPTGPIEPSTVFAPITEKPGTRIGPYKLLQQIGEGGFGVVFMAEQERPVRRRVALKIIKLGMDTRQVVARFEAERQALALMDHPNIAKVLDAGATDSGRPYFVMEYVPGDPITHFADAHKLSVRERLELFAQVCSAVQHAHTKGVIHRDIKPRNVLVSMSDGRPLARVIDFGIAKATGSPLTDKTLFTEHRQLIGTPEYMSPEQADGSPDIDTRTDVYALGVLLYELLTGATPFDAARLRSAAYAEMQRIIKEEDPPRPSLRIEKAAIAPGSADFRSAAESGMNVPPINSPSTRSTPLATLAAARQCDPTKLCGIIKGELDWIVMKSLDKDRARRYETPNQLAADVQRHLSGEPVVAAPPSLFYLMRKFMRKHKVPALVGSVAVMGIVSMASVVIWQNAKLDKQNTRLDEQNTKLDGQTALLLEERKSRRLANARRFGIDADEKEAREALEVFIEYFGHTNDETLETVGILARQIEDESERFRILKAAIDAYYSITKVPTCQSLILEATLAHGLEKSDSIDKAVAHYTHIASVFPAYPRTDDKDCLDTLAAYFILDECVGETLPVEHHKVVDWLVAYPNNIQRRRDKRRQRQVKLEQWRAALAKVSDPSVSDNVSKSIVDLMLTDIHLRCDDSHRHLTLALAYYRTGQYAETMAVLSKLPSLTDELLSNGEWEALALTSMTQWKMTQYDEARATITKLRKSLIEGYYHAESNPLVFEAEALIEGHATNQPAAASQPADQPASPPASLPESRPGGTARE